MAVYFKWSILSGLLIGLKGKIIISAGGGMRLAYTESVI